MNTSKKELINSTNGKIFSVTFYKKDGTLRQQTVLTGVKKHLKGGTSTTAHLDHLVSAYSIHDKRYTSIPLPRITQLVIAGNTYNFEVTL